MEQEDHKALRDVRIDSDYIDVESESVDISVDANDLDKKERERGIPPSSYQSVDLSHTFGRMRGDGSGTAIDESIDSKEAYDRDDRGGDTGMDISDAQGHYADTIIREGKTRSRAEWLQLLNNGYRESWESESRERDNQMWLDTICSRVDVTPHQKAKTKRIIDSVRMDKFGGRPYTVEIITLAALSLATEADRRMVREERTYRKLVADLDQNTKTIRKCREMIKDKSPLYE